MELGVATLRIAAGEVRRDMDAVLVHILQHCAARTPPPATPVPLPVK
jgi:very-short-patch-repair endonuclease